MNSDENRLRYSNLLHPVRLRDIVSEWLKEDTPNFDYGGFVVGEKVQKATLFCKEKAVIAGVPFFDEVFKTLDCFVEWHIREGDEVPMHSSVATVTGKARNILLGERVALNIITRASGISTYARNLKKLSQHHLLSSTGAPWHGEIAGTRKTTPGFRMVEKYSLLVGGLDTHRYDLSSMIMLKDNHIWSAGNINQVVKDARSVGGFSLKIEVECRSLQEALEAAGAGCDIVMLDNFIPQELHTTAEAIKKKYPSVVIEASGGINEGNIVQYFGKDIDVISLSKTTQGYNAIDFSLKICRNS